MGCKGCKDKTIKELNEITVDKTNKEKFLFIIIIMYTLLAMYGLVSLVVDIKNLFI
jgi:hypothetical protein